MNEHGSGSWFHTQSHGHKSSAHVVSFCLMRSQNTTHSMCMRHDLLNLSCIFQTQGNLTHARQHCSLYPSRCYQPSLMHPSENFTVFNRIFKCSNFSKQSLTMFCTFCRQPLTVLFNFSLQSLTMFFKNSRQCSRQSITMFFKFSRTSISTCSFTVFCHADGDVFRAHFSQPYFLVRDRILQVSVLYTDVFLPHLGRSAFALAADESVSRMMLVYS